MTNAQFYTVVGVPMLLNAVLVIVFTEAIKKRFAAARSFWRAELGSSKSELCEEFHSAKSNIETRFAELRALLERNHSETLSHFGDIDACLTRIENKRGIVP